MLKRFRRRGQEQDLKFNVRAVMRQSFKFSGGADKDQHHPGKILVLVKRFKLFRRTPYLVADENHRSVAINETDRSFTGNFGSELRKTLLRFKRFLELVKHRDSFLRVSLGAALVLGRNFVRGA